MKLAILTDMHWNWINHFWFTLDDIKKCDLIISLWDNEKSDLEIFKDLDIPKIWIHWNHDTVKDLKDSWLKDYWFENLHLKTKEINWIKFWGFDWNMAYVFAESMKNILNKRIVDLRSELLSINDKLKWINVLISHFPPYSIHDNIPSTSHRWLEAIKDFIIINEDLKYHFHGHLHERKETDFFWTSVNMIYWVEIIDI